MGDAWQFVSALAATPETNRLLQFFAGVLAALISLRFAPLALNSIGPLSGDSTGRRLARGVLALAASLIAGVAVAAAIGMLAQRS